MNRYFFLSFLFVFLISNIFAVTLYNSVDCSSNPIYVTDDNINDTFYFDTDVTNNDHECFKINVSNPSATLNIQCDSTKDINLSAGADFINLDENIARINISNCKFNLDFAENHYFIKIYNSTLNDIKFDNVIINSTSQTSLIYYYGLNNLLIEGSHDLNFNLSNYFLNIAAPIKNITFLNIDLTTNLEKDFIFLDSSARLSEIHFRDSNINLNNNNLLYSIASNSKLKLFFESTSNLNNINYLVYQKANSILDLNIYGLKGNINGIYKGIVQDNFNLNILNSNFAIQNVAIDVNLTDLNLYLEDSYVKFNSNLLKQYKDMNYIDISSKNSTIENYNNFIYESYLVNNYYFENLNVKNYGLFLYLKPRIYLDINFNKSYIFNNSTLISNNIKNLFIFDLNYYSDNGYLLNGDGNYYLTGYYKLDNNSILIDNTSDLNLYIDYLDLNSRIISNLALRNIYLKGRINNKSLLFDLNLNSDLNVFISAELDSNYRLFDILCNNRNVNIYDLNYDYSLAKITKDCNLNIYNSDLKGKETLISINGANNFFLNSNLNVINLFDINSFNLNLKLKNVSAVNFGKINLKYLRLDANKLLIDNYISTYDLNDLNLDLNVSYFKGNLIYADVNYLELRLNGNYDINTFIKTTDKNTNIVLHNKELDANYLFILNNDSLELVDFNLNSDVLFSGIGNITMRNSIIDTNVLFDGNFDVNLYNNKFDYNYLYGNLNGDLNTTKEKATNIVNGPYIGGNYWSKNNCISGDVDQDGICDNNFKVLNIYDYLPLFNDVNYYDVVLVDFNVDSNELIQNNDYNVLVSLKNVGDLAIDFNLILYEEGNYNNSMLVHLDANSSKTVFMLYHAKLTGNVELKVIANSHEKYNINNEKTKVVLVKGYDIAVISLNTDKNNYDYNDLADINVEIKNIGDFNYTSDINVLLYFENNLVDYNVVSSLDVNKLRILNFKQHILSSGSYNAKIILLNDGNSLNNEKSKYVDVIAVDLIAKNIDVNTSYVKDSNVIFSVFFGNYGDKNIHDNLIVNVYLNDVLLCSRDYNYIDANKDYNFSCNFVITQDSVIKLDVNYLGYDKNIQNNILEKTISCEDNSSSSSSNSGSSSGSSGGGGGSSNNTNSNTTIDEKTTNDDLTDEELNSNNILTSEPESDENYYDLAVKLQYEANENLFYITLINNGLPNITKFKLYDNSKLICEGSKEVKDGLEFSCYYTLTDANAHTFTVIIYPEIDYNILNNKYTIYYQNNNYFIENNENNSTNVVETILDNNIPGGYFVLNEKGSFAGLFILLLLLGIAFYIVWKKPVDDEKPKNLQDWNDKLN